MFLQWLNIAPSLAISAALMLVSSPKNSWHIPANLTAIALASYGAQELRKLSKIYEDIERKEDTLFVLQDTQVEEQLQYLQTKAETKADDERADKKIQRELELLEQTAPLIAEIIQLTSAGGAVTQMAIGMLQKGAPVGDILIAAADSQMQLEQAKIQTQLQNRQLELQAQQQLAASNQITMQAAKSLPVATVESPNADNKPIEPEIIKQLLQAAAVVGLKTACLQIDKAPSYQRLIFSLRTIDYKLVPKWKAAAKLAVGDPNIPMYVHGSEQIAIEIPLKPEERTFYDFPKLNWHQGRRLIILGKSLDGDVIIDLASEDTPQILCVGTTGSGKSNLFRAIAYCLLMQGCRVDICGGKVSDYEDFTSSFKSISMSNMDKTFEYVGEYYLECDRRNRMTKEELSKQPAWTIMIDEYKGTVPYDDKLRKLYDQQLCEVARRGRGLKIHVVIGLQRGSKRGNDDLQGLPPDLRDNLPCRIAFRCTDATSGRMVLSSRGEIVTSLQGRGDGIVQSGLLDTRFQAYRFDKIPD